MTQYVYRVVDQEDSQVLTHYEPLPLRDAQRIARQRNQRAAFYKNGRSYRVQRAAVVWEDVDNG